MAARVGIVFGSPSDREVMDKAAAILDRFDVEYEIEAMSAHRNPERVRDFASTAADRGLEVIIAGAGLAAHLAGACAAHTTLPVIGVPMSGGISGGLDALLSTAQMPRGVPVATVAVDGAVNAAVLAVQIMALHDEELRKKLGEFKQQMAEGLRL